MRKIILSVVVASLVGCGTNIPKRGTYDLINTEMAKAAAESKAKPAQQDAVAAALLPPLSIEMPKPKQPLEERFSLAFNAVPAQQFFMALVNGTRYSMLVHPDVSGTISANLKDVTIFEALDAIREQYGYDYRVEGTRIYVKPPGLQTKVFHVNYLIANRKGSSELRVTSGSITEAPTGGAGGTAAGTPTTSGSGATGGQSQTRSRDSSEVRTTSASDFWTELKASLEAIVGNKEGRSVVISPQSGVIVVRALWDELQSVTDYLKAAQLSIDRQVILEAKILEVQLDDGSQTGVNWAAFRVGGNSRISAGVLTPGAVLQPNGSIAANQVAAAAPGQDITAAAASGNMLGGLFGLAFQTSNFASVLSFLETQGTVHVLSSPRIATLNNQKAVLKVGTDDFFVTNVSSATTTGTTGASTTTTTPTVTLTPFFSGVSLDVTPQIDEDGNIILHVHPSVTNVTTVDKTINLGASVGSFNLPLASSAVSETDSVVRGQNGQIVVIGGLMRQSTTSNTAQVPGVGNAPVVGALFRNKSQAMQKRELVILLKPTIVQGNAWAQDMQESQRRFHALAPK
jgi:MSHA biogenesis protein MshL